MRQSPWAPPVHRTDGEAPDPPGSIHEVKAVSRRTETRDLSAVETPNDLEKLQETNAMLRAAIDALSPDGREIEKALSRSHDDPPTAPSRQVGFRLILMVVVLVFLILMLDLLLT